MNTLQQRIAWAFEQAKKNNPQLTRTTLWKACKASSATATFWFNGPTQEMKGEHARIVSEILGVDRDWLATGKGRPRVTQDVSPGPDIRGEVPLTSWVQAGDFMAVTDRSYIDEDTEWVKTTVPIQPLTFALRVKNDSMEPDFPEGTILIVEPELAAVSGDFVIANNGDKEATFKQLIMDGSDWYLKPLNDRYPIKKVEPNCEIVGVVRAAERRFR